MHKKVQISYPGFLMVRPQKCTASFSHEHILSSSYVASMHQGTKSDGLIAMRKRTLNIRPQNLSRVVLKKLIMICNPEFYKRLVLHYRYSF